MAEQREKLSDADIIGLVTGASLAATVPLAALMKALVQSGAVDKEALKRSLEEETNLDSFPPHLKAMLEPIWTPLLKIFDDIDSPNASH